MNDSKYGYRIFVDCGAPSLYNTLSRKLEKKGVMGSLFSDRKYDNFSYVESKEYEKYLDSYIEFLLKNKNKIDTYSNLDVINNPELTFRNQKIMEKAGLNPIPVFHLGCDLKWLDKYIQRYEYIALGGLVPNPTRVLIPILDRLFKEHILDKNGVPKVKVHGFACTSVRLMERYPWYSVDSTTCRKLAMYGKIILPEYTSGELKILIVSSRDISLNHRLTKGILFELEERARRFNMSIEALSTSIILRCVWNYLIFIERIQKNIPNWPWNTINRKSEKDANEFLTFFFAGNLSEKDELFFWNAVENADIQSKGRLQSFFYQSNLKRVVNLKFNS